MDRDQQSNDGVISTAGYILKYGTLIAAWASGIGWFYGLSYFRAFGISLGSLDLPIIEFPISAFRTLFFAGGVLGVGLKVVCGLAILFAVLSTKAKEKIFIWLFATLCVTLLVVSAVLATLIGKSDAHADMLATTELPRIQLQLKDGISVGDDVVRKEVASSDLRLLFERNNRVFVFVPEPLSLPQGWEPEVLEISRDNIYYSAIRVK